MGEKTVRKENRKITEMLADSAEGQLDRQTAIKFGLRALVVCLIVQFVLFAIIGFSFDGPTDGSRNYVLEVSSAAIVTIACGIGTMIALQIHYYVKRFQHKREVRQLPQGRQSE